MEHTILIYHQRRFICPNCNKTKMETNPFSSFYRGISDKTIINVLNHLKRYNNTFNSTSDMFKISVTEVINIFDKYCQMKRNNLSKVICLDEIYFSRHRKKKYVLVILNFFNRSIIDIIKDRDKSTLSSYFRKINIIERNKVNFICIDMNDNYKDILNIYFKNSIIVVDSFHVVKYIHDSLDSVRKRILKRFDKISDEYYLLKYKNDLLYSTNELSDNFTLSKYNRHFKYYYSDLQMLHMILGIDEQLSLAYDLYHQYILFNNTNYSNLDNTINDLNQLINDFKLSNIPEFISLANTLFNWKFEIVNSFIKVNGIRVSNGPIEGRNSLIKKVIRLANGYSNFNRFRNRIIYSLNKLSQHNFK